MRTVATIIALLMVSTTMAKASHYRHRYHHHFGRYLAERHVHYHHRHLLKKIARHRHRHRDVPSFALTQLKLPDGQRITVNAPYADRWRGFFGELFDREWK